MRFQVDQSGRIEETNRDTVVGLASKEKSFTLRVPARVKRQLLEIFRRQGKPKIFPMVVFGIVVGLAVKKSKFNVTNLDVDIEYPGHEELIQGLIKSVTKKEISFSFKRIGKNSPAHEASYFTYIGERRVNRILKLKDIGEYLDLS